MLVHQRPCAMFHRLSLEKVLMGMFAFSRNLSDGICRANLHNKIADKTFYSIDVVVLCHL